MDQLPDNCFYNIIKYLCIDERKNLLKLFRKKYNYCFRMINEELKTIKSIGIHNVNINENSLDLKKLSQINNNFNERWYCSDELHIPLEFISDNGIQYKKCDDCNNSLFECILKNCPSLESLDLRGIEMTAELAIFIFKHCPNLNCLRMESISFQSSYDIDIFIHCFKNRLHHLSIDNLFLSGPFLSQIFNHSSRINELHLSLYPADDTEVIADSFVSLNLEFLSIYFFKISPKTCKIIFSPHKFIDNIAKSSLIQSLQFLRIRSSYCHWKNYNIIESTKKFENLLAVNFNFMIYANPMLQYNFKNSWLNLKSLTLDFYILKGSRSIAMHFLNGGYNKTLLRLRILDLIYIPSFNRYFNGYNLPNLKRLELIDVAFKKSSLVSLVNSLMSMKNLQYLRIEYTFKEKNYDYNIDCKQNRKDLELFYQFPSSIMSSMELLFSDHQSIETIIFIDWPGLNMNHVKRFMHIININKRDINFIYKYY